MKEKGFSTLLLIIGVMTILGISLFVLSYKKDGLTANSISNAPLPTLIPTKEPTSQIIQKYTSTNLGVSFEYPDNASVKEVGNKIYINFKEYKPEVGQYIEVFTKNKDISFQKTLEEKFLIGKPDYCKVELHENTPQHPNYITAGINFPIDPDNYESLFTRGKECGENYAMTNGRRYFLYDPEHSSQYAFVSIGQYSIDFDNHPSAATWDQTINFLQ